MLTLMSVLLVCLVLMRLGVRDKSEPFFNVDIIFVLFQALMTFGGLIQVNPGKEEDRYYALFLLMLPFTLYVIASIILSVWTSNAGKLKGAAFVRSERFGGMRVYFHRASVVPVLIFASILISFAYYYAIGYNFFLQQLISFVSGGEQLDDIAAARFESYSGSRYLFPGYVNQFKNSILPALTIVVIHQLFSVRSRYRWLVSLPLSLVCITFLLGTGQRAAFVVAALIAGLYVYLASPRNFRKWMPVAFPSALGVFVISTALLGRSSEQVAAESTFSGKIGVLLGEVISRALGSNQESAIFAYYYVSALPVQFGAEWGRSILGLLPGVQGSDVGNQVYEMMFGTDRGYATPSLWVSVYHNFGVLGVILVPVALAVIYRVMTNWIRGRRGASSLQLVGYAGISVVLGVWVAGGPVYVLNTGVIAYGIIWAIGAALDRRTIASADRTYRDNIRGTAARIGDI